MEDERKKIMEKRSSLRSWRERTPRRPRQSELLGIALVAVIFLVIMISAFMESPQEETPTPTTAPPTEKTPTSKTAPNATAASIPAPSIKLSSPEENKTYNTSTPPLDFIVAGSQLDTVLLSVDGGENITIPHDGTLAQIDFARGDPLFIEDFSGGAERWSESGNWKVEDGKYVTTGGTSSFGDPTWNDYIIEAKTKIDSGKDISIDFRWDGESNHYRVQTYDAYNGLYLYKMDSKGHTNLLSVKLPNIDPADWHIWKIIANGSKLQAFIDGTQYIEYTDNDNPYLRGKARLRAINTATEYDYIHVYKPLLNGPHNLTLFANNTAGISSAFTIHFTTNEPLETQVDENKTGGIGDSIKKGGFEVILTKFNIRRSITTYLNSAKKSGDSQSITQSTLTLQIKNMEEKEKSFKLEPSGVILDDLGNQYEMRTHKYLSDEDQIEQGTIYPRVTREGVIYFDPITVRAKEVTLILYINGIRYDFAFNPFM